MSEGRVVAVVGATGAVGKMLIHLLESRKFPVQELRPLASTRSVGFTIRFAGRQVPVQEARPEAFDGAHFVFFAATGELSKVLAPEAVKRGAIVIDKSATFRLDDGVPLVVPEVNQGDIFVGDSRIIASPNCTTIGVVIPVSALERAEGVERIVVTTFQAVSGAGDAGVEELRQQQEFLRQQTALQPAVFPAPIADNIVPCCERFRDDGYTTEEWKLLAEQRKILHRPDLRVTMTCARVPVFWGHSASVFVELKQPLSAVDARRILTETPGVVVFDDPTTNTFPTTRDVVGRDEVLVGRIRQDIDNPRGLWMWTVVDNIRKGAATNAIQIAERIIDWEET